MNEIQIFSFCLGLGIANSLCGKPLGIVRTWLGSLSYGICSALVSAGLMGLCKLGELI